MADITPQQAASIILERRSARGRLDVYASRVPVPGCPAYDIDDDARIPLIETKQAEHHRLILGAMQQCMETRHGRLMICAPPGSAKSTYASVVAPAWYLGREPGRRIILSSYGDDLARRHGRRTRQLLRSPESVGILQTDLAPDSRAADEFALANGSEYIACGILGAVTGNRAHGIIIDDPIRGRQDADSQTIRDRTWAAYEDDLLTRLIPGGWVVIIQCMTGDTLVTMADGSNKRLDSIKVGDEIATYDNGELSTSIVWNWAHQGVDFCFTIRTSSGVTVTANERHPFLVERNGRLEWTRLRDITVKDRVVRVTGASDFILETIVDITPTGYDNVYDIQVKDTENFIANGLVSHNTRWHEDDLSGRILPDNWAGESGDILCRDGNVWRVLCLQAECQTASDPLGRQTGEMLWPEWFDSRHWDQFRLNRRTWSSLYQQRPAPDEGILFRRDDMATEDRPPINLRIIGASDYAATPDGGDWTEHGVAGIADTGEIYLLDWWRGQVGPEVWIEREIDMMARWSPLCWYGEAGPIRRSTEGMLRRRMSDRGVNCRLEWMPSVTDKASRAQAIIACAGMGRLFWPRAAWVPELQRQCLVFPAGAPDDGVDTLGLIGRGAASLGRRVRPPINRHNAQCGMPAGATGWMGA